MISPLIAFLNDHAVLLMTASAISLVVGLLLLPVFITRIPVDYFSHPHRQRLSASSRHPLIRLLIVGIKNLLGIVFVVAGLLMLFLPGQGLLTLLVGLIIMNYPGKFALEGWLIQRPYVLPAVNWLRTKYNHPPLLAPSGKTEKSRKDVVG
jgi:archaellum biogenesis protein FlaJ (TadC family)